MRCLVVGGPGFIGAAACRELMRRGVETVAASRTEQPYGTFTSHVAFDRRDPEALARALERVRPDVLLDLACYRPAEVAEVIRHFRGARYVFVSTGVYPDLHGRPAREEDFDPLPGDPPPEPADGERGDLASYLEGKRWCETLLARSGAFPWVVIRPPAVFGAGDHSLRIAAYIQRVEDGGPLLVPRETYRRQAGLAWNRDVGYACALAADPGKALDGLAFNVALEGVSLEHLIQGISSALGRQARLVPVPDAELPAGASPYSPSPARGAGYDLSRSRAELGFQPSALEDALAETLAWYRASGPSHPGYAGRARELEIAAGR